jgi:hypothetical protein
VGSKTWNFELLFYFILFYFILFYFIFVIFDFSIVFLALGNDAGGGVGEQSCKASVKCGRGPGLSILLYGHVIDKTFFFC